MNDHHRRTIGLLLALIGGAALGSVTTHGLSNASVRSAIESQRRAEILCAEQLTKVNDLQLQAKSAATEAAVCSGDLARAKLERDRAWRDTKVAEERVAYLERMAKGEVPNPYAQTSAPVAPAVKRPDPKMSEDDRVAMSILLARFQGHGLFGLMEGPSSRNVARITVRPLFYTQDFDDKVRACSVAWAVAFGEKVNGSKSDGILSLIDSKTGKSIGTFSTFGLRLD